jgi:hypothetical protein
MTYLRSLVLREILRRTSISAGAQIPARKVRHPEAHHSEDGTHASKPVLYFTRKSAIEKEKNMRARALRDNDRK